MRLDSYVVFIKPDVSRSRAKALIEAGSVILDGVTVNKPSFSVDENVAHDLIINTDMIPYVSRGGLKLERALKKFGVEPQGRVCADIGASTGGFTDCLLKRGAVKVFAVDSGKDQLAESLRKDERVISLEGFNARNLTSDTLGESPSLAVADLSFISQTLVLDGIYNILADNGEYIGLIKPQFECGRAALNKNGIVKDKKQHILAIKKVIASALECGFKVISVINSPIKGGDGNREFLFHAIKTSDLAVNTFSEQDILNLWEE